jgi:hypothetical protein
LFSGITYNAFFSSFCLLIVLLFRDACYGSDTIAVLDIN